MFSLEEVPWTRLDLLSGPTPIHRIGPNLWVKREDLAGGAYGGNKVRKLEWLLGNALELGGDVLSLGAVGSHHLLATAFYGRQAGIRVHGVVSPQPDNPHVRENARALHAWAERLWVARSRAEVPLVWARARLALRAFSGFPPVIIPLGGSNVLGATGWVGGGLEIARQVREGQLPAPARVVVPLGSTGTLAGLWLGLRLGGLKSRLVGVRVVPMNIGNGLKTRLLARRTLARLRSVAHAPAVRLDNLEIVDREYGDGYGLPTPQAEAALHAAAELGLTLETTYSAKAFAHVLATESEGPTLFIATASSRPMGPLLASALLDVPSSLSDLFR